MNPVREPLAIVGMSCRAAGGVDSPHRLWEVLAAGVDTTSEVPAERGWSREQFYHEDPAQPGTSYTWRGGFLQGIYGFDPLFFGMSSREAQLLDPQHRLAMEVAWEAVEYAGIPAGLLAGSRTGVYMGALGNDYLHLQFQRDPALMGPHSVTGSMMSGVSGRISYALDLRGPSLTVDTACSSSLMAVHLACQALWQGEVDLALAGGVNVLLSPEGNVMLSQVRALARDGRCKTFDRSADGYGRAEGAGVVILKRMADAMRDGDLILACMLGTAANQDGRHAGFTVPNGFAQEAVVREALTQARVAPDEVAYIEAHGTGTALGDPIEMRALARVFGGGKRRRALYVGSVKTNLGHAESAAGILALIKTVLVLQHRQMPPHLHLTAPNAELPLAEIPAEIPTALTPLGDGHERLVAGVSATGFSGTNVHVVVAAPPDAPPVASCATPGRRRHLLVLSGKTERAVVERALALANFLQKSPETNLADICYTLQACRTHFDYRFARVVESGSELLDALHALVQAGEQAVTRTQTHRSKVLLRFGGDDAALVALGRTLLDQEPVFREALERCEAIHWRRKGRSLLAAMRTTAGGSGPLPSADAVPLRCAVHYALARLWAAWGVPPDAVVGLPASADGFDLEGAPPIWHESACDGAVALTADAGADALLAGLADLYRAGYPISFTEYHRPAPHRRLVLPTYPFQRKEFRLPEPQVPLPVPAPAGRTAAARTAEAIGAGQNLLGERLPSPLPVRQFASILHPDTLPDVRDTGGMLHIGHYCTLLAQAGQALQLGTALMIRDLVLEEALVLGTGAALSAHTLLSSAGPGAWEVWVSSCAPNAGAGAERWTSHLRGQLTGQVSDEPPHALLNWGGAERTVTGEAFYQGLQNQFGLALGPSVRWLTEIRVGANLAQARLRPPTPAEAALANPLGFPAGVLDAAAQVFNAMTAEGQPAGLFVVTRVGRGAVHLAAPGRPGWVQVRLSENQSRDERCGDLALFTADGRLLAQFTDVCLRRVDVGLFQQVHGISAEQATAGSGTPWLLTQFESLPDVERVDWLGMALRAEAGRILDAPEPIPTDVLSLADMGFDSLMAMELQHWAKRALGVQLALSAILGAGSLPDLSAAMARQLTTGLKTEAVAVASASAQGEL